MNSLARMKWATAVLLVGLLVGMLAVARPGLAQDLSALARLDLAGSSITDDRGGLRVALALSQPVPWRVRVKDDPPRLILDMREVDWTGVQNLADTVDGVVELRAGVFRPGWSRLVMELRGPMAVATAEMTTAGTTGLSLHLEPVSAEDFARHANAPEPTDWTLPQPADLLARGGDDEDRLIVVLDPGHGGLDPGAERDGQNEATLMLLFARELKELLTRDGRFVVVMTREADTFVPLETRVSIARAAGADVFVSLHADALAEGEASGATVFTLAEEASDAASAALAERHDRDDLLAGVDLKAQDDQVAQVLMDMARTETAPKTRRLAEGLVAAIQSAELKMHRRPLQTAGFSVLKSPDIPSVLIEVGFLSSARDLARLLDPDWRARMAEALRAGLLSWARAEAELDLLAPP